MKDLTTKVVGVAPVEFTTDDGKTITGTTIYYTEPLEPERGQGSFAESYSYLRHDLPPSTTPPLRGKRWSFCTTATVG